MTLLQLFYLALQGADFKLEDYRALKVWAHTRGIYSVGDLWLNNSWLTSATIATRTRSSRQVGRELFNMVISFLSNYPGTSNAPLHESTGWYWNVGTSRQKGWAFTIANWRTLLPENDFNSQQCNLCWDCTWSLHN
jgi:hypothetical protein